MDKVHVVIGPDGFRWTRRSENGEVVAASTEAYVEKADALQNIEDTQGGQLFQVVDDT